VCSIIALLVAAHRIHHRRDAGDEPTDWSFNLQSAQQLLVEPSRQFTEGPAWDAATDMVDIDKDTVIDIDIDIDTVKAAKASGSKDLPHPTPPCTPTPPLSMKLSTLSASFYKGTPIRWCRRPQRTGGQTETTAQDLSSGGGGVTIKKAVTNPNEAARDYIKANTEKKTNAILDSL
jgi:hypothetical protein